MHKRTEIPADWMALLFAIEFIRAGGPYQGWW